MHGVRVPRHRRARPSRRGPGCSERGAGLLSSLIGVACVVAVLGVAANLTLGLWTRSTVDAVAYDAALDIATTPAGQDRRVQADRSLQEARRLLGSYGERVRFELEAADGDVVVLRVQAPGVELLPALVGGGATVGDLDRRIVVRAERP